MSKTPHPAVAVRLWQGLRSSASVLRAVLATSVIALPLVAPAWASRPWWTGVEVRHLVQAPSQPDRHYAIGSRIFFRSDDGGRSWTPRRPPSGSALASQVYVAPHDAQRVFMLTEATLSGAKPALYESRDGGDNWTPLSAYESDDAQGRQARGSFEPTALRAPTTPDGEWWATDGQASFRSTDPGRMWLRQADDRRAFDAQSGASVSYSLQGAQLWRSIDGLRSWQQVQLFAPTKDARRGARNPTQLLVLSDTELVVRNAAGRWLQSDDAGESWRAASNGFQRLDSQPPPVAGLAGPTPPWTNDTRCSVKRSPASTNTMVAICAKDNGSAPIQSCIHVSSDRGRSWTPHREAGAIPSSGCGAQGLPAWWTATSLLLDATDERRMLAGWMAGGLYRSNDGGQTWVASDQGLKFRERVETHISWASIGEPPLIQAVLYRDEDLLQRTLAGGADINAPGHRLGGVLDADLSARELERKGELPITPTMWTALRKLGANPSAASGRGSALLLQAQRLKLTDVVEDLVRGGYDWGASSSKNFFNTEQESELHELLSMPPTEAPVSAERLVSVYLDAAHFHSADQTTLDLLDADHGALAIQVLKSATRKHPFDKQPLATQAPRLEIVIGLWQANAKPWARRVFATVPRSEWAEQAPLHDQFMATIAKDCDPADARWAKAQGLPLKLAWHYDDCLSDKTQPLGSRLRVLRAMDQDGGIPPESWRFWLDEEDKAWVKRTAIFRRDERRRAARGDAIVGIWFAEFWDSRGPIIEGTSVGYPAEREGLRKGDVLETVDGHSTLQQSLEQVRARIAGTPKTWVRLGLRRGDQAFTVRLQRQPRPPPDADKPAP